MRKLAVGILRLYQRAISPWFPPSCRFEPTCSQYSLEAVERYGIGRGTWLTVRRLARCHPFGRAGFDAVP